MMFISHSVPGVTSRVMSTTEAQSRQPITASEAPNTFREAAWNTSLLAQLYHVAFHSTRRTESTTIANIQYYASHDEIKNASYSLVI